MLSIAITATVKYHSSHLRSNDIKLPVSGLVESQRLTSSLSLGLDTLISRGCKVSSKSFNRRERSGSIFEGLSLHGVLNLLFEMCFVTIRGLFGVLALAEPPGFIFLRSESQWFHFTACVNVAERLTFASSTGTPQISFVFLQVLIA